MPARLRILVALLAVGAALALVVQQAGADPPCSKLWTGGSGSWSDTSHWGGAVPGIGDVVCIPAGVTVTHSANTDEIKTLLADGDVTLTGGTLQIDGTADDSRIGTYSQTNGVLDGAAKVVLTNGGTWGGGTMDGDGTTVVPAGKTLSLNQFTVNVSGARVLDNQGTMLFATASSGLSGFNTARIVNEPAGVIRKTVGSSTATATTSGISAPVENDGKVESVAALGNLSLGNGSGGTSTGTYGSVGAAGQVTLSGSAVHTLGDGARLLDGSVVVGNVDVVAAAASPVTASGASMTNGTVGGGGVLSITGPFRWAGGTMDGAGTTVVQAGQTMTLDQFTVNLSESRVLDNVGSVLLATASSGISGFNTAKIVNEPAGVIRKTVGSSTATATTSGISAPVENDGKVESVAALGNLSLGAGSGGTSTGSYGSAAAAGQVTLSGSPVHTLGNGAKLLDGVVLSSNVTIPSGATVSAAGAREISGTLGGPGTLTVTGGTFTYTGGTMNGTGVTSVAPGATLAVAGPITLADTRDVEIGGLMTITGDHFIGFSSTALIHVLSGGTMRKTGGTNASGSFVSVPVRNDGTIETQSGRLELFSGTGVPDTGTFKGLDATNHVVLSGTGHVLAGTAKLLDFSEVAGDVAVKAGDTLPVASEIYETGGGSLTGDLNLTGTLHWNGGDQEGPGTTTVAPAGRIVMDNGCFDADLIGGRRLVNQGTIQLLRHSIFSMFSNTGTDSAIENAGTIAIDDSAAGDCTDSGISGSGLLHNTGTIRKLGGTGNAQLTVTFDNDGTLQVDTGTVTMSSDAAVTQSGTFASAAGASYVFDQGTFVLAPGASLTGSPTVSGGELQIPDGVSVNVPTGATLLQNGGTISGAGNVRIFGTLTWKGGDQLGPGTTSIEAGGTATVTSADPQNPAFAGLESSRSLVNAGTLTVDNGTLLVSDGGSILNRGAVEVSGASSLEGSGFGGGFSGLLHNVGTLRKSGPSAVSADIPIDNDGTIEVTGGGLDATGLLNYTDDFILGQHGALVDGSYVVRGGSTLGVPGEVRVIAGRVVLDGPASQLVTRDIASGNATDATSDLRKIAGNGELELAGGKTVSTTAASGPFANAGSLRLGNGTAFNATGGYVQSPGAVLHTAASGTPGLLAVTGAAALAGRLDVLSAPASVADVVTYGSHTGTFPTVTGSGFTVGYDAGGVSLHAPGHLTVAGEPAPAKGVPVAAAPQLQLDAAALTASGPWAKRGTYLVATRRGAKLVRRGVSGRGIDLVAATGPRAGAVRVTWAGRSRTVSLRAAAPGRRTIRALRLARRRTGTVVVRTRSSRRVAIASLVVRR